MPGNGDLEISETLFIFSLEFSQLLLVKQVVTWQALAQQLLGVLGEIKSRGLKSSVPVIHTSRRPPEWEGKGVCFKLPSPLTDSDKSSWKIGMGGGLPLSFPESPFI